MGILRDYILKKTGRRAGLNGLPNEDTLEELTSGWDSSAMDAMLFWRLAYARRYKLKLDEVLTDRQIEHFLVALASEEGSETPDEKTVGRLLSALGVDSYRVGIVRDDIADALRGNMRMRTEPEGERFETMPSTDPTDS